MAWVQLSLDAPDAEAAARLDAALLKAGALAVTFEDAADQPVLEPPPGATPLWRQTRVIGLFDNGTDLDGVRDSLRAMLDTETLPGLSIAPLADRDWTRAWMDRFHPMAFGRRLWICPNGFAPPEPAAVNLRLDPGLAFGTGTHPTTALCLEWLDVHELAEREVVDFGCGSGVLGIAALLLGAHHVQAVDNDPQALIATRDNADKNGVGARLTVAPPDRPTATPADLLLANILAGPIVALASTFAGLTRTGGEIVLSGILEHQAPDVGQTYAPWFEMREAVVREGWMRLEGRRK